MPAPRKNESKNDFISRCMGDSEMLSKFPDQEQRAAVCYSYYKSEKERLTIESLKKSLERLNSIKSN